MDVLDSHCERLGRNPADICRTRLGTLVLGSTMEEAEAKLLRRFGGRPIDQLHPDMQLRVRNQFLVGDPDTVAEKVSELMAAGLDGLIFNMTDAHDLDAVAQAGDVLSSVLG